MKLPKYLTTVTTLSKILAMILFILLPILGFKLGMGYQKKSDTALNLVAPISSMLSPYVYPSPSAPSHDFQVIIPDFWTEAEEKEAQKDWKTYSGNEYSFLYPPNWHVFSCDMIGNGTFALYASPQPITCSTVMHNITYFSISIFSISINGSGFDSFNFLKPDKTSKIVVDGEKGISGLRVGPHVQDLEESLSPYLMEVIIVPHNKTYYEFMLRVHDDPDSDMVRTFHRIISTFKFKR